MSSWITNIFGGEENGVAMPDFENGPLEVDAESAMYARDALILRHKYKAWSFKHKAAGKKFDCVAMALSEYLYELHAKETKALEAFAYAFDWKNMCVNVMPSLNFNGEGTSLDEILKVCEGDVHACPISSNIWKEYCDKCVPSMARKFSLSDDIMPCVVFTTTPCHAAYTKLNVICYDGSPVTLGTLR